MILEKNKITFTVDELESSVFLRNIIQSMIDHNVSIQSNVSVQSDVKGNYIFKNYQEPTIALLNNRIPNTSDFLNNKFSKAVIKEHFDNESGEVVTLDNTEKEIIYLKKFACPHCNQSSIITIYSDENDTLNSTYLKLYGNGEDIICTLDIEKLYNSETYIKLNEKNLNTLNALNHNSIILLTLEKDNSFIIESNVIPYYDKNTFEQLDAKCCNCGITYTLQQVFEHTENIKCDKKCVYCGSNEYLDFKTNEYACENSNCYSNRKVD